MHPMYLSKAEANPYPMCQKSASEISPSTGACIYLLQKKKSNSYAKNQKQKSFFDDGSGQTNFSMAGNGGASGLVMQGQKNYTKCPKSCGELKQCDSRDIGRA